jgi:hypothetical protein
MCQYRYKSSNVKLVKAKIVERESGKINEELRDSH